MIASDHFELVLSSSDIIALVSTVFTILSIVFGVYQLSEARKARQETRVARNLLLKQQVSQHLSSAASKALNLFRALRAGDWQQSWESGVLLCADLANAEGFPEHLAGPENREKILAAVNAMSNLMHTIPAAGEDPSPETKQELIRNCQTVLVSVSAAEGSMRLSTALGGDPNEHSTRHPVTHAEADAPIQSRRGIGDEAD